VRLRDEVEQSKYAFGQVNLPPGQFAEFHRDMFNKNYDFAKALIASNLVLPALDFCLKCSHLFNILDASGSIGVTERTSYILRVRQLAVSIAKAWVDSTASAAEGVAHGS
jgi:glycyl-tRNA synthetase alpha chain